MTSDANDKIADWLLHIPATISVSLPAGQFPTADDITPEAVASAVGRWVELRNGQDFDSDEFEVIDGPGGETLPDGVRPSWAVLSTALGDAEIRFRLDDHGLVAGVVAVEIAELLASTPEEFTGRLSSALVGSPDLLDVSYAIVGHEGTTLHLQVAGNPRLVLAPAG